MYAAFPRDARAEEEQPGEGKEVGVVEEFEAEERAGRPRQAKAAGERAQKRGVGGETGKHGSESDERGDEQQRQRYCPTRKSPASARTPPTTFATAPFTVARKRRRRTRFIEREIGRSEGPRSGGSGE